MQRICFSNLLTRLARFVATGALAASAAALAQTYPSKPINWVVGFPPGGGADAVTRMVAAKMSQNMGVSIVVENRPGASAIIATQYVPNSIRSSERFSARYFSAHRPASGSTRAVHAERVDIGREGLARKGNGSAAMRLQIKGC